MGWFTSRQVSKRKRHAPTKTEVMTGFDKSMGQLHNTVCEHGMEFMKVLIPVVISGFSFSCQPVGETPELVVNAFGAVNLWVHLTTLSTIFNCYLDMQSHLISLKPSQRIKDTLTGNRIGVGSCGRLSSNHCYPHHQPYLILWDFQRFYIAYRLPHLYSGICTTLHHIFRNLLVLHLVPSSWYYLFRLQYG